MTQLNLFDDLSQPEKKINKESNKGISQQPNQAYNQESKSENHDFVSKPKHIPKVQVYTEQMLEFLKKNLLSAETYQHVTEKQTKKGFNHFLQSQDASTMIILLPEAYTGKEFTQLNQRFKGTYDNLVFLPVKDGVNYFRTASFPDENLNLKSVFYKKNSTLKNYSTKDLQKCIHLSPMEIRIKNSRGGEIIYFQPDSERLEEMLVKHQFTPLIYDYSHLPAEQQIQSSSRISKEKFLWLPDKKAEYNSGIFFDKNKICSWNNK